MFKYRALHFINGLILTFLQFLHKQPFMKNHPACMASKLYKDKKFIFRLQLMQNTFKIKGLDDPPVQIKIYVVLYAQQQIKIILPLLQIISKMASQAKQVYPEDWSCIIDPVGGQGGLYIGNLQAAQNINTLKKLQIRAVLTAAKGVEISHPKNEIPYVLYVPAQDHESFDISKYFHQGAAFIHQCLQRTNIMVHCLAGVSRSVSLSIAFLLKHKGLGYKEAYGLIKGRRKIIHPNDGFIEQLKKFERDLPPIREQCKSLSPQKTYQKEYSVQSYSPTSKQNKMDINSIIQRYQSFRTPSPTKLKNPQYQYEARQQPYSPQKSTHRLKRFVSNNIDTDIYSYRQSAVVEKNAPKPFGNAENRIQGPNRDYSDIDKRIEQIRKKYQEYAPTLGLSSKYNNYVGQNAARGRTSSSYANYNNSKDYEQNNKQYVYSNRTWVQNGRQYGPARQYGQTITQNIREYPQNPRQYGQNIRQYGQQSRQNWQNGSRQYGQYELKASKIKRITSFQQY